MESESNSNNHDFTNALSHSNNSLNLTPVAPEQSGNGLPYAPENFPNSGDIWRWRTGKRVAANGNFRDRYLYLPPRLIAAGHSSGRGGFASKLSVERFLKESFPDIDVLDFFAKFSWTIPSTLPSGNTNPIGDVLLQQFELEKQSESDFLCDIDGCKAGNLMCSSLILEEEKKHSPAMPCDICCTELNFCRECCCILCCKTVDSAYGGYSYIMCKVKVGDNICGHVAHMECALRAHMAGTVGGMIGLDAEYYCRRCDGRTELISHANKILLVCEAIDSEGDIKEKMLNLGMCLLCGSQKAAAKELMSRIALAMSKLKRGNNTEDILNVDDKLTAHSSGFSINGIAAMDTTDDESPLNHLDVRIGKKYFGYRSESLKLEADVDQVLEALRKSQKYEYNLAEESLNEHKKYLQNLYQQLDREKSELASQPNGSHSGVLFETVKERKEQLRRELMKFENMKRVANGFGSTSKDILEKYFGL